MLLLVWLFMVVCSFSNIFRKESSRLCSFKYHIIQQLKCRPRMFTAELNVTVLGLVCSLSLIMLGCFAVFKPVGILHASFVNEKAESGVLMAYLCLMIIYRTSCIVNMRGGI